MTIDELWLHIKHARLHHTTEEEMQWDLLQYFEARGIPCQREARLSDKERVASLVGDIAVECKTKGPDGYVFRQVKRYLKHECVSGVILVTSYHMGLPEKVGGKKCLVVKVGQAWL